MQAFIMKHVGKLARYGAVFISGWLTQLQIQHSAESIEGVIAAILLGLIAWGYSAVKKP